MIRCATVLGSLLLLSPGWAINKCTTPDGRISYQDEACPAGHAQRLDIPNPPARQAAGPASAGREPVGVPGDPARKAEAGNAAPRQRPGSDKVVYTGPRGGRYTIGPSGRKNYLPRDKQ